MDQFVLQINITQTYNSDEVKFDLNLVFHVYNTGNP